MLVELVQGDREKNSGLHAYLRNMMAVMAFDAERRGRLISKAELAEYTRHLAVAVTEALHYFIGHGCQSPQGEARYLAVTAAHITHMLRDTLEDAEAGYFNIPREVIESHGIGPREVWSNPYRKWVQSRVEQARACFKVGRDYLAQVENLRCRLAGYAYIARFDRVLEAIEQDGYRLRSEYPECESLLAGPRMIGAALSRMFDRCLEDMPYALPTR
jgi:phytoene/squalene synthetase